MANDKDVCSDNWKANKKDEFTWVNSMPDPVIISQDGTKKWPFTLPSPIDVAGQRSNHQPGRTDCGILDNLQVDSYTYNVYSCRIEGNPKTVIIS
jgi:hypothetical protein